MDANSLGNYFHTAPYSVAFPYPEDEGRNCYFRCPLLAATLSLRQCRRNRFKLSLNTYWLEEFPPAEAIAPLAEAFAPLADDLQPFACWSCELAPKVESGGVAFYPPEEVLEGRALGGLPPRKPVWPGSAGIPAVSNEAAAKATPATSVVEEGR